MSDVAPSTNSLIPINDCVLVKLDRTDKRESKYDTRTSGIVASIQYEDAVLWDHDRIVLQVKTLLNKRVYFEEYKEGARIKRDGELFCFIKIEDIRGYEDV